MGHAGHASGSGGHHSPRFSLPTHRHVSHPFAAIATLIVPRDRFTHRENVPLLAIMAMLARTTMRGLPSGSVLRRSGFLAPHSLVPRRHRATAHSGGITRIGTDDPRMSRVVVHGGIVYISGQTAGAGDGIAEQTAICLRQVEDLLAQGGTDKARLLTANIWVKDMPAHFAGMNAVWNAWLDPDNKPVRATVQADMARPEILVEVQVTAALP